MMQPDAPINRSLMKNDIVFLNYTYSILVLLFISAILITAFYFQVVYNEIPCPLCLLQRAVYLAIGFSVMLNLRNAYSLHHDGLTLLMTLLLLIISTRQTLLDIYPRPGHEYVGSAILGLHMPVWSIVISVCLLFIFGIKFLILGYCKEMVEIKLEVFPTLKCLAHIAMWLIITLCALNLLSSFIQCGLESCHTTAYRLL